MSKNTITFLAAVVLSLSTAAVALGQTQTQTQTTTTTVTQKTVQKSDGTYTVIEYPVGKETTVSLNPIAITGATGTATILRDDTGTRIKLNLTGVPAEVSSINLYAVDENGVVTSLGPVEIASGAGTFTTTAPLSKFMIIASPEANLTAYDPNAKIIFRSAVPAGFAVIPYKSRGEGAVVGERVSATTSPGTATSAYRVPMLNIPGFRRGTDTHMKINFAGAMTGARANVSIEPRKDGPTEVRLRFHELKEAPAGQVYVLWAVSPDNKFTKLGQIVNAAGRNEAEIRSEVALSDFGLLVTMEDAKGEMGSPGGTSLGVVEVIKISQ
jgi:hypothetical protein